MADIETEHVTVFILFSLLHHLTLSLILAPLLLLILRHALYRSVSSADLAIGFLSLFQEVEEAIAKEKQSLASKSAREPNMPSLHCML